MARQTGPAVELTPHLTPLHEGTSDLANHKLLLRLRFSLRNSAQGKTIAHALATKSKQQTNKEQQIPLLQKRDLVQVSFRLIAQQAPERRECINEK